MSQRIRVAIQSILVTLVTLSILVGLPGCGGSDVTATIGAEERFAMGKALFDDEDYLGAIDEFQIVKIQFQGSAVADDAQYYLGECHYMMGEFLLAVEEYRTLRRTMASSPMAAAAQYKVGMCYYELSPGSTLDQSFTRQAIDEFQAFVEYYPEDERRTSAEEKIKELNARLALKLYESGLQYMKLGYYRSAGLYFDFVTQQYHDSPYAEDAFAGKVRSLIARHRIDEARTEIARMLERFPESEYKHEFEEYTAPKPDASAGNPGTTPDADGRTPQ